MVEIYSIYRLFIGYRFTVYTFLVIKCEKIKRKRQFKKNSILDKKKAGYSVHFSFPLSVIIHKIVLSVLIWWENVVVSGVVS